jgi:flagellar L-ring protein precursor FlgH
VRSQRVKEVLMTMRAMGSCTVALLALASIAGCTTVPETIVQLPTTAKPKAVVASPANGTIFQVEAYRPLFEDRRPRRVGDGLTGVCEVRRQV